MKKTTWHGWLFLGSMFLIIVAAVLWIISDYTKVGRNGQIVENWAIGVFVAGVVGLIAGRVAQ